MQETIKYWKGLEELENTPEFAKNAHNEFPEFLPINEAFGDKDSSKVTNPRRDFLKLMGFGIGAAALASCEAPVRKAIPYLNKPEVIDPGIANWYASTYFVGGEYNSVLVKTREGRPIKLEGNPLSGITKGGLGAKAQASVLSLYDNNRLKGPLSKGTETTWEKIDEEIKAKLSTVNGKVVLVSSTVISPSTKQLIREFGSKFSNFEHVVYDANSASALVKANGGVVPGYDFSKAKVIVSVGADFLGTWISPIEYSKQYIVNRKVTAENPVMSRHYQFETILSLTGSNADVRVPIKASEEGVVVASLYNAVAKAMGGVTINTPSFENDKIAIAAKELIANKGNVLVVSGSNDIAVQTLVKELNMMLGAEGNTITASHSYLRQGDDAQMLRFVEEMNNGSIGAVMFYNANPVYDHLASAKIVSGLKKVALKISFADRVNETAAHVDFVCPDNHYLESWNDFEPKKGYLSIAQPAITPIFKTRQFQESLLAWSGRSENFYDYMKSAWRNMIPSAVVAGSFTSFWDKAVHDGVVEFAGSGIGNIQSLNTKSEAMTLSGASVAVNNAVSKGKNNGIEVVIYEKIGIGTGVESNNPWLQEFPDPISKATWGNYLAMPIGMAKEMNITQGDVLKVTANGVSVELPALIQPGQAKGTVSIAMGYGHTHSGPVANGVGANAFLFATVSNGSVLNSGSVKIEKTNKTERIAQTQTHQTVMGRNVVQETTLTKYANDPKSVTEYAKIATPDGPKKASHVSLWKDYEYNNHHWGMVIDLNSCIGCGSCTVGCQAENNVPVVGKEEVLMSREMSWIRIDRYYSSDATREDGYTAMEHPADNPQVIFQPMMCQHCNHAPCETVCPVAATMHSSEGLNQMAYNRCVGTRYCANNCPYKVRRFNWFLYSNNEKFDYNMNNDLGKMVLNPDVVVRSRGVMEKCSMCVQRIQAGKLDAKKDGRRPKDGEIQTACAQSCPTNAIVFGDMNDKESEIYKVLRREDGERAFHVLEEINVQPNVTYLTKVRNLV